MFFVIAASVGVLVFALRRLLRPKTPAGPATNDVLEGEYTVETPEPPARIRHDD